MWMLPPRGIASGVSRIALILFMPLYIAIGWRVSEPLAAAGWILTKGHFPPYGTMAGLALGIAVWQYLIIDRRVGDTTVEQ